MLKIVADKAFPNEIKKKIVKRFRLQRVKAAKKDKSVARKQLKDFEQQNPAQMELFGFAQPHNKQYSNTIELYDFMPKYVWGKVDRINGKFLDSVEREFEYRKTSYKLQISPARLKTSKNVTREFFPGMREELVEDALRRLATVGQGVFLDEQAGVVFTIYQLQQELKDNGHSYSYDEIKDAIRILTGTTLTLSVGDGQGERNFSPFTDSGFVGEDGETKTFVRFSPLVTRSIQENTFLLANYETLMQYDSIIARQLHKRMSHHYTQAGFDARPYNLLLTSVIRDIGLTKGKFLSVNLPKVDKALKEMVARGVLSRYEIEKVLERGTVGKMIEAKLNLYPSHKFVNETKSRNARHKEIALKLGSTVQE